jgi:hypothetical protein
MGKVSTTLAEALLRRKELNDKVAQLAVLAKGDVLQEVVKRVNVTDSVDDVRALVPKVSINEVTAAFDSYAGKLRRVDAAIQKANWDTTVEIDPDVLENWVEKKK